MLRSWTCAIAVTGLLAAAASALADDAWELTNDDTANTVNALRHAVPQEGHDLEGTAANPDVDWMRIMTKERHSYEARVSGLYWEIACGLPPCPRFERTTPSGTVLTAGTVSNEDVSLGSYSVGSTMRWIATTGGEERLRATGDMLHALDDGDRYDVVFYDTTLFVPRWNNTATQTTVLLLQNATNIPVIGTITFHSAAGAVLGTAAVEVPPLGLQVLPTASVPGLAGQSGAAEIAQMGGYGALTGKAVALEPATGFTFDTSIVALPR
jgi:hypothetical protein